MKFMTSRETQDLVEQRKQKTCQIGYCFFALGKNAVTCATRIFAGILW